MLESFEYVFSFSANSKNDNVKKATDHKAEKPTDINLGNYIYNV